VDGEPQDIRAAMRDVLARVPDPDTVPERIEMHPSLFRRLERTRQDAAPSLPFSPYLLVDFDTHLPPDIVRVIYRSGRKDIIVITPSR
jgi:hypothetical protein